MILMFYNKQVCKEFLLPNLHDADYTIWLYREIFHLKKDIEIHMENSAAGWEIVSSRMYFIKEQKQIKKRYLLKGGDIIELETMDGERFQVIVVDSDLCFPIIEKYDISSMREISVGKGEDNLIRYQFLDLVSALHISLIRHSDGWYLKDTSSNGVFCENIRVRGMRKLSFADHIELFGLHIFYLGDLLAVGTAYGRLEVKKDGLKLYQIPKTDGEIVSDPVLKNVPYFHRSPRKLPVIQKETVEIEAPPNPKIQKQKPLYLTIGPAFTMAIPMMLGCGFAIFGSRLSGRASGAFMYTGLITAVASAFIGVLWAFLNLNYSKKEYAEEENQRFNAYSNYLIRTTETLRKTYQQNTSAMLEMYPSAAECLCYGSSSAKLWNRNVNHSDFLYQRLGLGEQPFQVKIEVPKEKFTLINDSLMEKPGKIQKEFQTLHKVPVGISLTEKHLIGLVGGTDKKGAVELMHMLVAGIAAAHCYTDVKFVFVYREHDRARRQDWECMRWFPHVWSDEKNIRYMAADEVETSDIFFELSNIIRRRIQQERNAGTEEKSKRVRPHYILFLSDPSLIEGELIAKYVYQAKPEYGLTTFLMVENADQLPNECEEVIENDAEFRGMYNLMDTEHKRCSFVPDRADRASVEKFGKTLANIRVKETRNSSEIPNSLDFLQMYDAENLEELHVLERWRKNRSYHSMRALIGKKGGNADCYLDIHEKFHGPHGLIAGTTGSGKSETLQTYILSLALNFSPEDVSFFLIDFKGGGMANLFTDLPHLAGQISNLSGNQIHRAMISIKSENMRRQRLLSEYGVNKIDLYTRLYKNHEAKVPMPHLLIIIDEFAELKREEPDFMQELISVAQVGRSLGVHLILATQKPSGTVDENIWSNSKFRICLRVQDKQDSNDMLHKPDAAFLTRTGRGYFQVGNDEIYELFQSGYSGAPYQEKAAKQEDTAILLTRTGKAVMTGRKLKKDEAAPAVDAEHEKQKTQLEAVIEYLGRVAAENQYRRTAQLWLPVLKNKIYLADLPGERAVTAQGWQWKQTLGKWNLEAAVGLYDDPERQAQKTLKIPFSKSGHLAVCGGAVSGKSTFLQTMIFSLVSRYSPDILQMYLLDFSSHMLAVFEEAPHVGGIVFDNQEEKLEKFIHMFVKMMEERKQILHGGNYSQYVQAHGVKIPALLLVVDNMAAFREKTKNKYDEILLRLAREGVGYGIFMAVTAAGFGISEIPTRIGDNIRTVFSLEQADKYKYMDTLRISRVPILPEAGVHGRGLAVVEERVLEFQTALSIPAADDFERGQLLEEYCGNMNQSWKGKRAKAIPEIPQKPTLDDMEANEEYQKAASEKRFLPAGYRKEDGDVYKIDLSQTYCYTISGKSGSGKTNLLKILLYGARKKQGRLCVIETKTLELKKLAMEYGADYVTNASELFTYLSSLLPEFSCRNQKKRILQENGLDEEEMFEQMKEETPIFIFAADLAEFFRLVYRPGAGIGNMSGFIENIMEKGSLHNIYFFGCLRTEDQAVLSTYKAYSLFISYQKGIHLGGNLNMQKIFNFQNYSFAEQTKAMKKGRGCVPDDEEESIGREVVIPLAKVKR